MDIVDSIFINLCNEIKSQANRIHDLEQENKALKAEIIFHRHRKAIVDNDQTIPENESEQAGIGIIE